MFEHDLAPDGPPLGGDLDPEALLLGRAVVLGQLEADRLVRLLGVRIETFPLLQNGGSET